MPRAKGTERRELAPLTGVSVTVRTQSVPATSAAGELENVRREQSRVRMSRARKRRAENVRYVGLEVPEVETEEMLKMTGYLEPSEMDDPAALPRAIRAFILDAIEEHVARNTKEF